MEIVQYIQDKLYRNFKEVRLASLCLLKAGDRNMYLVFHFLYLVLKGQGNFI
ncbi:hypothetical protein [Sulfuracidifex tepidarius]|uniref:Uncharacterized protein n=1 Tax=Sulfuracidifex tepidarius TaxID=1294262 RepID=A0A510E5W8_9CREN|nr:hypothetical protein [Sulfuracidifex tepidarius]BBG25033.1 hypothetical protein IC006_2368 [Sulfuracidifex tepidarius]BBG27817.1 hypothetical protein IC007_2372 [Sulfuracidifex tepidarius]